MLSLATLGIAWSGYQAAKWSGLQARRYTQASTARSFANQAATLGAQDRTQDLLNFNRWLEVSTDGNTELADLYERRFRDEFRPAFEGGWPATRCTTRTRSPSPLREANYELAERRRRPTSSNALGDVRFEQGKEATEHADDYVFVTVFFAIVLFFAGISLRFTWLPMRLLIMGLGTVILVYGGIRLAAACRRTDAAFRSASAISASTITSTPEHGERIEGQRLACAPTSHASTSVHPLLRSGDRTRSRARPAPSPAWSR